MFETIKAVIHVSEELHIAAATLLPVIELTLGVMLLLKIKEKETLIAVTILFLFFLLFSFYGTVIGLENDCGCFGEIVKSKFGLNMIFRNTISLVLVLSLYMKLRKK